MENFRTKKSIFTLNKGSNDYLIPLNVTRELFYAKRKNRFKKTRQKT